MSINTVRAYLRLNLKSLVMDKVSFVWSIIFPALFILSGSFDLGNNPKSIAGFHAYVIFYAYVIQIVVDAIYSRNAGNLKVYFSIRDSKKEYFIASLLTEMLFSTVAIIILNVIATFKYGFDYIQLTVYGLVLVIACVPVAFLFFSLTLIKSVSFKSLSTITSIVIAVMAFMLPLGSEFIFNWLNPLFYMLCIIYIPSFFGIKGLITYAVISIVSIIIGMVSINKFSAMSNEVR